MRLLLPLLFLTPVLAEPPKDLKAFSPPLVKMMAPKPPKSEVKSLPAPERAFISNEVRYYIDSPEKLVITSSPPGYFEPIEKKGPLTVVTKFSDDPTVIAEKEFKGPFVYWLKPKLTGPCEILALKEKIATEKDILRQMADVDNGTKPIPPPKPVDPDVVPVNVETFRVIFGLETGSTMSSKQNGVIYGKQVEDWLTANCTPEGGLVGWRRYDKNTDASKDQPAMAALWAAIKPKITGVPFMAVEVNGKVEILDLPADPAAALVTLKAKRGTK